MSLPHNGENIPSVPETIVFFDELIDDRFAIAEALEPIAQHEYMASRYSGQFYTIPEPLAQYIPADSLRAEVALNFSQTPDGNCTVENVKLELEDGPVLKVVTDGPFSIVYLNDESQAMFPSATLAEDTIRSLVPLSRQGASVDKLAKAIHQLSAHSSHRLTAAYGDSLFTHLQVETDSDTQDTVIITRRMPHASGKVVQLQTTIQETLNKQPDASTPLCDLVLSAGTVDVIFEEVVDGRPISIKRPTPLHTTAIRESVESLLEQRYLG